MVELKSFFRGGSPASPGSGSVSVMAPCAASRGPQSPSGRALGPLRGASRTAPSKVSESVQRRAARACPARSPERPADLQEATINRTMDRSMVGECLGRVIVGQGVSLVAAEVVTVAELCAKAHLPPQLVSDRRDAGAQPYPPDAFATGARAPGPIFPIGDAPVRALSHPGRGRPLTCTSLAAQRGPSCDLYRFVQNRRVDWGSSLGMTA